MNTLWHRGLYCVACLVGLGSTGMAWAAEPDKPHIEILPGCPAPAPAAAPSLILFDDRTDRLSGWSHAGRSPELAEMRLPLARYAVAPESRHPEPDCDGATVFETVLVKKYADWDRQHVNGLEPKFAGQGLRFGQVAALVLELRLRRADSAIPDTQTLAADYGAWLDAAQREAWDGGRANLGLTLFEAGYEEQDSPSFTAARIVEIDPATQADRWLRITVPIAALSTYTEQHWMPTPRALADFAEHEVLGLRINPETRSGQVLRNFRNPLPAEAPEHFKEMAIELRRVEIRLREDASRP
ncbi:hypothetical protein [Niveibacterium sp. SC-1]|uniref:hypothetical protein n=1 Tax=Niveibacterium sp. SC-1 TaxID=3135646 RepID=UPI00311E7431